MRLGLLVLSLTLAGFAVWTGVGARVLSSTPATTVRIGKEDAIRRKSDALPIGGDARDTREGQGDEEDEVLGGDVFCAPRSALLLVPVHLTGILPSASADLSLTRPLPRRLFRPPRTT